MPSLASCPPSIPEPSQATCRVLWIQLPGFLPPTPHVAPEQGMTLSVVWGSLEESARVQQVVLWSLIPQEGLLAECLLVVAAQHCCREQSRPPPLCPAPRMQLARGPAATSHGPSCW